MAASFECLTSEYVADTHAVLPASGGLSVGRGGLVRML